MIYLSYNESDLTLVNFLNQQLKKTNLDIWFAPERLLSGQILEKYIDENLPKSESFLLCIGKLGLSKWQEEELAKAYELHNNKKLKIIPILLPNSLVNKFPKNLTSINFIDFRKGFKNNVETKKLLSAINGKPYASENIFLLKDIKQQAKQSIKKAVSIGLIKDGEILILQRAENQKSGNGLWQLPGGKLNENETDIYAAQRRIKDEVGLNLQSNLFLPVSNSIDTWIIDNKDDYIVMSIFVAFIDKQPLDIAQQEFKAYKWLKISEIFNDKSIIYFGSTEKYIKNIRRYILSYMPLKEISEIIEINLKQNINLPTKLKNISIESTQTIYSFLSVLGFLTDKGNYKPSSTLSHLLLKILSEWALTDGVVFEAMGENKSLEEIRKSENPVAVAKFKEGFFDHHENLLGLLSRKLPKALSTRYVADLLIFGKQKNSKELLLLIRWDYLAGKYQIPSKGLEGIGTDIKSTETAKIVVKARFEENLVNKFKYEYLSKFETQHIGAGSLSLSEGDGPMMRKYIISVFRLLPNPGNHTLIIDYLSKSNLKTFEFIDSQKNYDYNYSHNEKRELNFYLWVSTEKLIENPEMLLGEKIQGFSELVDALTLSEVIACNNPLELETSANFPIITRGANNDENIELLDKYAIILKNEKPNETKLR